MKWNNIFLDGEPAKCEYLMRHISEYRKPNVVNMVCSDECYWDDRFSGITDVQSSSTSCILTCDFQDDVTHLEKIKHKENINFIWYNSILILAKQRYQYEYASCKWSLDILSLKRAFGFIGHLVRNQGQVYTTVTYTTCSVNSMSM